MNVVRACQEVIKILRQLDNWHDDDINELYNLCFKLIRKYDIRRVK